MNSTIIYELRKVTVYDFADENRIDCNEYHFGFFEGIMTAESFIRKHNHEHNCFFIMRSWVFNPMHNGQATEYLWERTYDINGKTICDCPTHHFILNFKQLFGERATMFSGRTRPKIKRKDIAWYYDRHNKVLQRCIVDEVPCNKTQAKKKSLEWYDDSYIVYPLPLSNDLDDHKHVLSCYMITNDKIEKMIS